VDRLVVLALSKQLVVEAVAKLLVLTLSTQLVESVDKLVV
jgi:hypothetical protein